MSHYVAVGSDGTRMVVWGMGATFGEAIAEATEHGYTQELETHPILPWQVRVVESGDVSWPIRMFILGESRTPERDVVNGAGYPRSMLDQPGYEAATLTSRGMELECDASRVAESADAFAVAADAWIEAGATARGEYWLAVAAILRASVAR